VDIIPRTRSGVVDIISLLGLYAILFVIILFFTDGLVADVSPRAAMPITTVGILLVVLSAALLGLLAFFLVRLKRSRDAGSTGVRLRSRLVLYFIVVAGLTAVPQAALFWRALARSTETWFNARMEKAIQGASELSIEYSSLLLSDLEGAAVNDLPDLAEKYLLKRPSLIFENLFRHYDRIEAVQVMESRDDDQELATIAFSGAEAYRFAPIAYAGLPEGPLPSISSDSGYAARYLKDVESGGRHFRVVLTMGYPRNWVSISNDIGMARGEAGGISEFLPRYRFILAGLYLLFCLPMLLVAILLALRMSDIILRPVSALEQATVRIAKGNFAVRLLSRSQNDFAALTTSFNHMVGELERFRSIMLQNEKISVWQDIAQKLAHEIKNPLTPIRLSAERVLRRYKADPGSALEIVEPAMLAILQEVEGLTAMLADFKSFARLPEPQFDWTNVKDLMDDIVMMYASSNPSVRIDASGLGQRLFLRADKGHLRQLFVNLINNAVDAMGGSGRIAIRADLVKRSNSSYCRLQVQDSGPGIPEDIRDKLFTPYFTTKENGTGLGLSIVEHIVIDHKGEIWFESERGKGTTFFIDLPTGEPPEGEPAGGGADKGD
jgi:nitrogen fixation/metabolism regulation signal transduction histidine kinase